MSDGAASTATGLPATASRAAGSGRGSRRLGNPLWLAIEAVTLLLAPAAAFFALRVRPMAPADMIDPYFYSGYAQNGAQLVERFGDTRYWVRLGFIIPARLSYVAFGAADGFYVFRYVLLLVAIVPTYVLFKRLSGRAAGAVAVAAIFATPVTWASLGSDYPDSSAYCYLLGGITMLAIPSGRRRTRVLLLAGSGILLTLAIHSQVVALPIVGAAVFGYAVAHFRRSAIGELVVDLAILAAAAVVVTFAIMLVSKLWGGYWDIFSPTLDNAKHLRSAKQIVHWHSDNNHWIMTVPYILQPLAVCGMWILARLTGDRPSRAEWTIGITAILGTAAGYVQQFHERVAALEFHYWSSMLWPGLTLTTAFVVVRICRRLLADPRTSWIPVAIVLAVPFGWGLATPMITMRLWPWPVVTAILLVAMAMLGLFARHRAVAAFATAAMLVADLVLVAAVSTRQPLPHTSGVPVGKYYKVFGFPSAPEVDKYAVSAKIQKLVPHAERKGDPVMFWWVDGAGPRLWNQVSGGFLFHRYGPQFPKPGTEAKWGRGVLARNPRPMVLLSLTGAELPKMLRTLQLGGTKPRVVRKAVERSGKQVAHVWIVRLDALDRP